MKKRLQLTVLILACLTAAGCQNKPTQIQTNADVAVTSSSTASASPSSSPSPSVTPAEIDYSKYSGTWVPFKNLKDDYLYGTGMGITVDKTGNIKGEVSSSTENLTHISNVDIQGKINDNKFAFNFQDDSWGHSGTIQLDFKENNIILSITYSENSSKENLWGIGEGTFTLVNSNTKVNRTLSDLKDGGLQVIENQCFNVNLENYGSTRFISGLKREDASTVAKFYLADNNGNILYKFPDFYGNQKGMFSDISAVSFADVNGDKLKDIIIIADYGPKVIASIYFQKGNEFANNSKLDDKINNSSNNNTIAAVLKFAKEQ